MRIVLLGLGDIAEKAYLPIMANLASVEPILVTRNSSTLLRLQQQYRIALTANNLIDALQFKPDAVMIHSNTASHYELVKLCLEQRIAVFVDKPISDHFEQCQRLIELAAQMNTPLFVGFNRRYAPLYQAPLASKACQIHYQKNRFDLPSNARNVIFDDFIHLLDFLSFATHKQQFAANELQVYASQSLGQLNRIQVSWQQQGALFTGSMNRQAGHTFERLELFSHNEHWQVDNLRSGWHSNANQSQSIGFDDWQSTLEKRGFVAMIGHFLQQVASQKANPELLASYLASHQLAELLLLEVGQAANP